MLFFIFIVLNTCLTQFHVNAKLTCLKSDSVPEQIRIAIRPPDGVVISWKTYGMVNISNSKNVYGINDTPYPKVVYSQFKNFTQNTTATGNSTNYYPFEKGSWFHNVAITVKLSTVYYYIIMASNSCVQASPMYTFKTQPIDGDRTPLDIVVVGDLAIASPGGEDTVKVLTDKINTTDLYLHVGDISYSDDVNPVFPVPTFYEDRWNDFQQKMQDITSQKFYMTAPGNHEVTCIQANDTEKCVTPTENALRNFTAYLHRFRMPGDESKGFQNLWYSFNYGMVHFVILTSETDFEDAPAGPNTKLNGGNFRPPGNQTKWLIQDLQDANKNRSTVPWIIVAAHRPYFGSVPKVQNSSIDQTNCNACRQAFAKIFEDYNVDFYFCGHVHWYERLFPVNSTGHAIASNYTYQPGTIYITSGAGGAPEGIQTERYQVPASAKLRSMHGYVNLKIANATHCELFFIGTDGIHKNKILDKQKIDRNH